MDNPLTIWYCDVCGEAIKSPGDGYLIWKTTKDLKAYDFKIIHQGDCDCDDHPASAALTDFLGERGATYLLSFLSLGPIKKLIKQPSHCDIEDFDEFVDLFRRLQTPYYEEARRRFGNHDLLEWFSDSNEVAPYYSDTLKDIIGRYKPVR